MTNNGGDMYTIEIGATWFAWGYHWRITEERHNELTDERELHTVPLDNDGKPRSIGSAWVSEKRLSRYGSPSLAYSTEGAAAA